MLCARELSGLSVFTSEKRALMRLRIPSRSGPWKILPTKAPAGASSRSARASASSNSAADRA